MTKEIEQREMLFRYWYSNGKRKFTKDFTIAEIENGDPYDEICDSPLLRDYKIVARLQYTGRRDNSQAMIFEGDRISDHNGIGAVEYSNKYAGFRVNYGNGQCKWFYDYLKSELGSIEIIGNVHDEVSDDS